MDLTPSVPGDEDQTEPNLLHRTLSPRRPRKLEQTTRRYEEKGLFLKGMGLCSRPAQLDLAPGEQPDTILGRAAPDSLGTAQ